MFFESNLKLILMKTMSILKNQFLSKSLFIVFSLLSFSAFSQSNLNPVIEFKESEYNFGNRKEGSDVSHVFTFTNTGTAPLIISDVVKSCGCTTPEWTNKPVLPGESGSITLKFDSKRVGPFNKSVTVKTNDPTQPTLILKISGTILASTDGAPLKTDNKGIPIE